MNAVLEIAYMAKIIGGMAMNLPVNQVGLVFLC